MKSTKHRIRRVRNSNVLAYLASIMVLVLVGMSIFELTKHLIFSHPGSWAMHIPDIASSVLIASTAGLITSYKFRSVHRETIRERHLRQKLESEIAERTRTEKKLRENEGRVRAIVDTAVDGIITINDSGTIETFNRSAEQIGKTSERAGLIIRRLRNFIGKQETKKVAINLRVRERITTLRSS